MVEAKRDASRTAAGQLLCDPPIAYCKGKLFNESDTHP